MRDVVAVIVGLLVGMATNMLFVLVNIKIYPMPEGVSMNDTEGLAEYIGTLPLPAFLIVLVAHLSQAFVGGGVAAKISLRRPMAVAMIVGSISLVAGVVNMSKLSAVTPSWMLIEFPLYLVLAWAAAKLVQKSRGL